LKDEDVVFPGIDEAIDLAGEDGDGPSDILDTVAELAGEGRGDQGIGDPGEQKQCQADAQALQMDIPHV
jgi:hypothetical protein